MWLLSDSVASLKVKRLKDRNETRSRDMREGRRAKKREETEIEGQEEQPGKEAKGSSAKRGAKKRWESATRALKPISLRTFCTILHGTTTKER